MPHKNLSTPALDPFFHELRSSLTLIQTCTELLMSARVSDPQELREFLEIVRRGGTRIDRLVNDFVTLTRADAGVLREELLPLREPTAIQALVGLALLELQPELAAQEIAVASDIPDDLPPVLVAPGAFTIMVERVVRVGLRLQERPGSDIALQALPRNGQVDLVVTAEGLPLQPQDLARIFERFFMPSNLPVKRDQQSLGMNLPVAQQLAQIFGGSISVESVARGNVFTISLPAGEQT